MKERFQKGLVVAIFLWMAALIIATYGCSNPAGPSSSSNSSCAGYAGGNETGRWAQRYSLINLQYEFLPGNVSIWRHWSNGKITGEFFYEKEKYNKITYWDIRANPNNPENKHYVCYEVNGGVLKISDSPSLFDRV